MIFIEPGIVTIEINYALRIEIIGVFGSYSVGINFLGIRVWREQGAILIFVEPLKVS